VTSFCALPQNAGLAGQLLTDADCYAFGLVERGYEALATPGGPVAAGLNGLLVLAVAFFGYRLLLGRGLLLSDAVSLSIKIGVVLVIATSWASWQTLAYDVFARAPTRIAGELLASVSARPPIEQLQSALDGLEAASLGYRTRAGIASPLIGGPAASAMTLNVSSLILAQSIVGSLVVARVILSILLALAPAMAGFILFDSTRGVASGWLIAMATAAMTPIFVLTTAAIEFAILLPLIARNLSEQAQGRFEPASVTPIGLVVLVFAFAMLASVYAGARIASGIRLPGGRLLIQGSGTIGTPYSQSVDPRVERVTPPRAVALALERSTRREQAGQAAETAGASRTRAARSLSQPWAADRNPDARSYSHAPVLSPSRAPRQSRAAAKRDA
jgi:type IV secretion system protein VirB6